MLIGYAQVSTHEQTLALQQDALQKVECNKIFTDTASGAKTERRGLEEALSYVRKDDTPVVWRLDRLGRSLPHLITTMTDLEERSIGFKSLTENIDTTTSGGEINLSYLRCSCGI
jgi:DNA invertase Pin-like site-specific DNA recombinase